MKVDAQKRHVREALANTARLLNVYRGLELTALDKGVPDRVNQPANGVDHWRVRLVPDMRPRKPAKFWNAHWCFYEIGVGSYPHGGCSNVQFFMAANRGDCGGGAHVNGVNRILERVARKRSDIEFNPIQGSREYSWLGIPGNLAIPDPVKMAYDIVWIIAETLESFLKLPDPPKSAKGIRSKG